MNYEIKQIRDNFYLLANDNDRIRLLLSLPNPSDKNKFLYILSIRLLDNCDRLGWNSNECDHMRQAMYLVSEDRRFLLMDEDSYRNKIIPDLMKLNHYDSMMLEEYSDDSDEEISDSVLSSEKLKQYQRLASITNFKDALMKLKNNKSIDSDLERLNKQSKTDVLKELLQRPDPQAKIDLELINKARKIKYDQDGNISSVTLENNEEVQIKTRLTIPTFRGISYFTDRWIHVQARRHRRLNEVGQPLYSEAVLQSGESNFYCDQNAFNSRYLEQLHINAKTLKSHLISLKSSCYVSIYVDGKYRLFDNWFYFLQYVYSNGIERYTKLLEWLKNNHPEFKALLPNQFNPLISMAETPFHANRYGRGQKKPYGRFAPITRRNRKLKKSDHLHHGKVYTILHPLKDFLDHAQPNVLRELEYLSEVAPARQIRPEIEASLLAYIGPDRVASHQVSRIPSFFLEFKSQFEEKYGMDKELYELFRDLLLNKHLDSKIYQAANLLLTEWLTRYDAIKQFDHTVEIARVNQMVLVFRDRAGRFTFDLPKNTKTIDQISSETNYSHREALARRIFQLPEESIQQSLTVEGVYSKPLHIRALSDQNLNQLDPRFSRVMDSRRKSLDGSPLPHRRSSVLSSSSIFSTPSSLDRTASNLEHSFDLLSLEPRLINSNYEYTNSDIEELLKDYLGDRANVETALHPIVSHNGSLISHQVMNFIERVQNAFRLNVPTVIPINTTQQEVESTETEGGTHWISLIIEPGQSPSLTLIDSLGAEQSSSCLLIQEILALFISLQCDVKVLNQQQGDIDCGAWLVDNSVRFILGQEFRGPHLQTSGADLRKEHAGILDNKNNTNNEEICASPGR